MALSALWWALAVVVLAHGAWWRLLAAIAMRRPRGEPRTERPWRFAVIVPAHNEEAMLGRCLDSLEAAPFAVRPEIIVVADNCTDATAFVARRKGATVLVRDDPERRGKGYALDFALAHLAERELTPQAVLFVDADTMVSPEFFEAIAMRLEAGASAVQVYYAPDSASGEGLARLRRLQFALLHWARPLGATRLRLGVGLKGNGMALTWDVAREGIGAEGLAEDAAMTLALARRGIAVAFEPRATVTGHVAARYDAARTQDERWERGRFGLVLPALATAAGALRRGRLRVVPAALDVASPPLMLLVALSLTVLALAFAGVGSIYVGAIAVESLAEYVVVGLLAARVPARDLLAMRHLPRFAVHKARVFGTVLARRGAVEWERTGRD